MRMRMRECLCLMAPVMTEAGRQEEGLGRLSLKNRLK